MQQPAQRVVTSTQRLAGKQAVIADQQIIGFVRFHADPYTSYYITTRYNLVKVKNNQLSLIGKLSSSNHRQYPYIISDQSTQLLVDATGNILTRQGRSVGRLTAKG